MKSRRRDVLSALFLDAKSGARRPDSERTIDLRRKTHLIHLIYICIFHRNRAHSVSTTDSVQTLELQPGRRSSVMAISPHASTRRKTRRKYISASSLLVDHLDRQILLNQA